MGQRNVAVRGVDGALKTGLVHGFEKGQYNTSIAFDDITRTLTLTPTGSDFAIYVQSSRYVFDAPETVVITDTEGAWYFYFDEDAVLVASQTPFDIYSHVPVAVGYWDAANKTLFYLGEERHGLMDPLVHHYLHTTRGAAWEEGLDVGNFTLTGDGSSDTHAQISVANGIFQDEDIHIEITHSATPSAPFEQILTTVAEIPVFWKEGASGDWRGRAATTFPFYDDNPNRPKYNEWTGATWQLTEIANNDYFNVFVLATNNISSPIMAVLGQTDHTSLPDAEEEEYSSLDMSGVPVPEIIPIARLTFQTKASYTNTPKAVLKAVLDYRFSQRTTSTFTAQSHNVLANRDQFPAHPFYALQRPEAEVKVTGDSPYSVATDDQVLDGDSSGGAVDFQLPPSADYQGGCLTISAIDISNGVTITPDGAETINGAAGYTFTFAYESVDLWPVSGGWRIR